MSTTTEIKYRPIMFSADMVRALLAGRKTQTRRPMKVQPPTSNHQIATLLGTTNKNLKPGMKQWVRMENEYPIADDASEYFSCPYGKPGDRLYVKETWAISGWSKNPDGGDPLPRYEYKSAPADGEHFRTVSQWKSNRFMPRDASRITLEIASVRVERVQDISESDARSEGIYKNPNGLWHDYEDPKREGWSSEKFCFLSVWDSMYNAKNKPEFAWERNPWVWCLEFKVVEVAK
jgi:hypothetical protein